MARVPSLVLNILSRTQQWYYPCKIKCINYQYLCFNFYYRLCHRPSILKGFKELVWSFILCLGKSKYGKVPFKINWLLKFQHKQTMSIRPVSFYIRNRDIYVMYPMIKVMEMYIAFEPFCEYSLIWYDIGSIGRLSQPWLLASSCMLLVVIIIRLNMIHNGGS